jgi:hypothetical protein
MVASGWASAGRIRRRVAASTNAFSITLKDAALEELRSQHSVRAADGPRRTRRFAIRFQDLMNVLFLAVVHG